MPKGSLVIAVVVSATIACGSSSNPLAPPTDPPAGSRTVSGTLVSYGDRAPMVGASVVIGQTVATTDAQGKFSLPNLPASGAGIITASASGFVFRGFGVSLSQVPADLTIDILRDAPPFSALFYKMWVRNAYESTNIEVTKPWTRSPSFYVRMIVSGATTPTRVDPAVVDRIRDLFEKSVPELSGGRFRVAAFETGDEERPIEDGWVNLTFYAQLGNAFGTATVGGNSGTMSIRYGMVSYADHQSDQLHDARGVGRGSRDHPHHGLLAHARHLLRFVFRRRLPRRAAPRSHPLSLRRHVLAPCRQSRSRRRSRPGHWSAGAGRRGDQSAGG